MTKVKIIEEAGFEPAALGLSLSYEREAANMPAVMERLFKSDGGHNKFLEHIMLWLDITAPRHWWQQVDTYRAPEDGEDGFLPTGMSKQSGSTMHTLMRRELTDADFEIPIAHQTLYRLNTLIKAKDLDAIKNELPEGFLQRRIVVTNYKALRNIIGQRRTHRNKPWRVFCEEIFKQCQHPEFLADLK